LFLIFSFFNVSALLFLFNFEFLPITFLVVYVGAVAVLFLFVLMMLNIKLAELSDDYYNIVPIGLIFGFVFLYQLVFLIRFEFELFETLDKYSIVFLSDFFSVSTNKTNFFNIYYSFSNIKLIGFVLFTDYLYHFLISGFVLLLAMVAAIVLTLHKYFLSKTQNVYLQILKDYNTTVLSST
jgi:NADH:ubiquinone oxidoreductase subunit 6 (subunit J)